MSRCVVPRCVSCLRCSEERRGAGVRARAAALALAAAVGWSAAGVAQTVANPAREAAVRTEFRTAARRLVTKTIDRGRMAVTEGAVSAVVARGEAEDLGRRDRSAAMQDMQLVLVRPAERQAAFDAQVEALHRRGDASFHHWLTPDAVGAEFGPAAEDLAALTSYLRGEGFTVNSVGRSGMYVDFSGTVAQVEQSFGTEIHDVRLPDGEQHFAAMKDAQIPEAFAGLVAGFVGLSDIRVVHPNYRKVVPVGMRAGDLQTLNSSAGPFIAKGGAQAWGARPLDDVSSTNYAVAPADFYTIYNETPLLNAATRIDGTGVTIALLEESAITPADVTQFRTMFGVSPATPVSLVTDTGYGSNTCTAPAKLQANGEEGEAVLDIEWAGAVAPGANLIFMQCVASGNTGGIFLSAEAVIDNNLADVMSLSYGEYEGAYSPQDTLANNLWEQAASQGQTVVVSAGDTGPATEDGDLANTVAKHGITSSSFSTTAWNVSAGGTDFMDLYNQDEGDSAYGIGTFWNATNAAGFSSARSYIPEMTWNDTCASSIYNAEQQGATADGAALCAATAKSNLYLAAGGGGPSKLHARPSWQTGTVYGLPTLAAQPNRLQPDVSLFAANGFWYHDLPSYESDESTPLSYAGGTSFVAPQLAGVFALIVQKYGERLGQPNYVLYNMAGQAYGVNTFTGSGCNGSGTAEPETGIGTTTSLPGSGCIFYDVQAGNISVDCQKATANCYVLGTASYGILSTSTTAEQPAYGTNAGWDMATGIGSLNIANLVNYWQTAAAGGVLYTPTVAVSATAASYTYGLPSAITYKATVSGSGSYPTGTVTFSGSGAISTIGNDALTGSAACATGGTCTETATQAYTAAGTLAAGSYTITASYLSTNENYTTASGTTTLTVNKQTPTVSVSAASTGAGTPVNLAATIAYSGSGAAPTGGLTFQVDSGAVVTATCTGTSSPLSCTYNGYPTTGLSVASHTISAVSLADANYAAASSTATLTVMTAPTIVFAVATHHTQDAAFAVSATSNSAGAITYSVVSGPATISGSTVTLTGASGTVVLQASQAASGSYGTGVQTASFSVIAGSVWFGDSTSSLSSLDWTGAAINSYAGGGRGDDCEWAGDGVRRQRERLGGEHEWRERVYAAGCGGDGDCFDGGRHQQAAGDCGGWRRAGVGGEYRRDRERVEQCGCGVVSGDGLQRAWNEACGNCCRYFGERMGAELYGEYGDACAGRCRAGGSAGRR